MRQRLWHEAKDGSALMRPLAFALAAVGMLALALLASSCGSPAAEERERVIRFHALVSSGDRELLPELLRDFERETGIRVVLVDRDLSVTERLLEYRVLLGARTPSVDVYQVDVIWTALLAQHFRDLAIGIGEDREDFIPSALQNNTVHGRLVALPHYSDAGLIYYRRDLLEEHGFEHPPRTWAELEEIALTIQEAERARGAEDFWGFLWSGVHGEGLTCEALEWQVAWGGGTILNERGESTVANRHAAEALTRARDRIGWISPSETPQIDLWAARDRFRDGDAAFLRHWGIAWSILESEDSAVRGKVGVAPLPEGPSRRAATLGGWQLAVSRYSENSDDAVHFVRWMTSPEVQLRRALEASYGPTRLSVLESPEFLESGPWAEALAASLEHAVARPSRTAGPHYSELSLLYSRTVHDVLRGETDPDQALQAMATSLNLWGIVPASE